MREMRSGFTFPIMDTGHDVVNYWKARPMIYCFSAASLWKEGKVHFRQPEGSIKCNKIEDSSDE